MLRLLVALLVLPLLLAGLVGCGGDDSKSNMKIQKPTQTTENSAATTNQKAKSE